MVINKVKIRKDLIEQNLAVPTSSGGYLSQDKEYPAKWIEDQLWVYDGVQWVEVESIDFE
jgi:hypothetical protein